MIPRQYERPRSASPAARAAERREHDDQLGPITFRLVEPGGIGGPILTLVGLGAMSAVMAYAARLADEGDRGVYVWIAVAFGFVAVVLPGWELLRSRRRGEVVIDPARGEIRISREYVIPFVDVRSINVVEHEYTYRAINSSHDLVSADVTGWGIDIGAGSMLFGENGLSRKRVEEIADALKARVDAYRARTGESAAPLPRPSKKLLERLAISLREDGEAFEHDWLALDGPMAELMREFHVEPDAQTMGPNGEFALALRAAGFELGEAGRP